MTLSIYHPFLYQYSRWKPRLTFNRRLALIGFRTTRPRYPTGAVLIVLTVCCLHECVIYLIAGKYTQMMNVLKPIAFDVVICMSQLFDYYLFAVRTVLLWSFFPLSCSSSFKLSICLPFLIIWLQVASFFAPEVMVSLAYFSNVAK